jgi:hypothetical protein
MPNLPLSSREYKLMLKTDRFKERSAGATVFLELIRSLVEKEDGKLTADDPPKEERRFTSFLDTDDLDLYKRGFVLRLREERGPKTGFAVDLKYRSPDRFLSAEQDMTALELDLTAREIEQKFEEDILPPFARKFSHSAKIETDDGPRLDVMSKAVGHFPGLKKLELNENAALVTVKRFIATEVEVKLCKFKFGNEKSVEAGFNLWYSNDSEAELLLAEFSFRYKATGEHLADKLENFPEKTVNGAGKIFSALQNEDTWFDPEGTTKTAFVFGD